jgi:hypothetical protein
MKDGPKSLRGFARTMAILGFALIAIIAFFKFGIRDESYTFLEAWDRGLVQSFLVLNAALILIAIGLVNLQLWARWAALAWGTALFANGIISELWHFGSISGYSVFEGLLIASFWTWFTHRELFAPEVAALFRRNPG